MRINPRHRSVEDRVIWLERMTGHVTPGKIVEFGCGSGFVLEFLSARYPESLIGGLDRSSERLSQVVAKRLRNVIPIRCDITQGVFADNTLNTALFVGVLHEVFSNSGEAQVMDALRVAHRGLDDEGVAIIQDFLKPRPRPVELSFKNEEVHRRFLRFAAEFRPRRVRFEETQGRVRVDIADGVEFISKYRSPSEEDWKEEMGETHFFYTMEDYRKAAPQAGFTVKSIERLETSPTRLSTFKEDIEFDFELDYSWVQVVLAKRPSRL
jgi:ubiquinone/menaquinone biosynthesis C-methylase UbiE